MRNIERKSKIVTHILVTVVCTLGFTICNTRGSAADANIDQNARRLLKQMAATYGNMKSCSFKLDITSKTNGTSDNIKGWLKYRKPNHAIIVMTGADGTSRVVADGKNVYALMPAIKDRYLKVPVPESELTIPAAIQGGRASGIGLLPFLIAGYDPYDVLSKQIMSLKMLPDDKVEEDSVQVVEAVEKSENQGEAKVQIKIRKKDNILRQVSVETSDGSLSFKETYTQITVNPAIPDTLFSFTPPRGYKAVATFDPPRYAPSIKPGVDPIAIKGSDMNGKEIQLSDFKGKVVLLDFWATWCGPCIEDLPNIVSVYEKYHKDGFDIIGIPLEQQPVDKDKFTKFLSDHKMPWPQILDSKNIGMAYGVTAIPCTILITKEGKIAAVDLRGDSLEPAVKLALGK